MKTIAAIVCSGLMALSIGTANAALSEKASTPNAGKDKSSEQVVHHRHRHRHCHIVVTLGHAKKRCHSHQHNKAVHHGPRYH